jgi:hypothetical protein
MATRRFGPTRGAGVAVIEKEGEKEITPGALGWCGYAGMLRRGNPGELILITGGKTQFEKKCGGIIDDSMCPDAAMDYFGLANGAGGLALVRVTDGNELPAELPLYSRKVGIPAQMGWVKAKNGGRWGGRKDLVTGLITSSSDITATTLTTGVASWKRDQWKGGYIEFHDVPNKRYPIVGNTAAGIITVAGDQTMLADYNAALATSLVYYITLEADASAISIIIHDGEELPDTEFGLSVYVDGLFVKKYPNLHTDPTHARYWVNLINNDDGNDEITVTDLVTGAHTAATRPAIVYGAISAVTTTTLTPVIHSMVVAGSAANPTMTLGATTDEMPAQTIVITMTSATAGTVTSTAAPGLATYAALGVPYVPVNRLVPPFTVTAGGTPLVATNTITITYFPMRAGELVNGFVYPDKVNAKREKYRIVANTHKLITVATGSDLTTSGAPADQFMVEGPYSARKGRDGNADVVDATYEAKAWDVSTSPFNRIEGRNMGLVKFATPGVTATAVQKAGVNYAAAKNHQYRYEVPANIVTEEGAIAYVVDTLGRSDFAVCAFPSFSYVSDPNPVAAREGKLKLVTSTGQIHGREARIAADYDGYHKAEAGLDAILSRTLRITTGDAVLNQELLNPVGIQIIIKKKGNFVIWGDRMLANDPTWKWKHQREQMSYYEHVMQENFDWIVFAINDPINDKLALNALKTFFEPEWQPKRALRGKTFAEAAIIKVDAENNTDATRAAGDANAAVSLKLADTVERFIITIGKMGIFEAVA